MSRTLATPPEAARWRTLSPLLQYLVTVAMDSGLALRAPE
jgi:hypothetical protein